MIEIKVQTSSRNQLIDITRLIRDKVPSNFSGLAFAYVPHTTAGITINEGADPSVRSDILDRLSELVPYGARYKHTEGNADSHIKSSLVGSSIGVIVDNGELMLGTWQALFFCEFDGPRSRRVFVELVKR